MRFIVFCIFVLLLGSFIISKKLTAEHTESIAEHLQNVYRKNNATLLIALKNCSRWKQQSCSLDGKCEGAFLGFSSMSTSASCIAAEIIAKEKGINLMSGGVL